MGGGDRRDDKGRKIKMMVLVFGLISVVTVLAAAALWKQSGADKPGWALVDERDASRLSASAPGRR